MMQQNPQGRGPQPLLLHLALAGQIWLNWPLLLRSLQQKSTGSNGGWSSSLRPSRAALQVRAARLKPELFAAALAKEGLARYRAYLEGVTIYRRYGGQRLTQDAVLCGNFGSTRLLDFAPELTRAPVLLVVPSLVNRYHILDLDTERSLLRWLVGQGIRPLLVDWGAPGRHEGAMTVADYIARLAVMARRAQQLAGGRGLHVLGHCLGGNLALGLAAAKPALVRSLILLSTPWDFHAGDRRLGEYAAAAWREWGAMSLEGDLVPAQFVQSLFALLQPWAVTEKFRQLSCAPLDAAKLRRFVLVEDWLNDGVPLTRPVCREIIEEWYGANRPGRGAWRVGDVLLRPRNITVPTLVVVPERDHIVPAAAAAALARQLPGATALHLPLGHIGMIVGAPAKDLLWRPVAEWIKRVERDSRMDENAK